MDCRFFNTISGGRAAPFGFQQSELTLIRQYTVKSQCDILGGEEGRDEVKNGIVENGSAGSRFPDARREYLRQHR